MPNFKLSSAASQPLGTKLYFRLVVDGRTLAVFPSLHLPVFQKKYSRLQGCKVEPCTQAEYTEYSKSKPLL